MDLHTDGGARGNPGPAAIGWVLYDNDQIIAQGNRYIGDTTNNVAEYTGLIEGLEHARAHGANSLTVYMDSELVVKQIRGEYRVRAQHLSEMRERAARMLESMNASITHVRRNHPRQSRADALVNEALDRAL